MPAIEPGLCQCGCGERTKRATKTSVSRGVVEGQPRRYVNGHNARGRRDWVEQPGPLDTPCWIWQGTINVEGYGVLRINYRQVKAHRWVLEQHGREIPEGLVPDHLCRNRACVNSGHLEFVTSTENVRRGAGVHLTAADAALARRLAATTTLSHPDIAAIVGTTKWNVWQIVHGRSWRQAS